MGSLLRHPLFGRRFAVLLCVAALAACSDPSDTVTSDSTTQPTETSAATNAIDLRDACFSPIVVQTDWYPQAEHGGIYELLGSDYVVDATRGATQRLPSRRRSEFVPCRASQRLPLATKSWSRRSPAESGT